MLMDNKSNHQIFNGVNLLQTNNKLTHHQLSIQILKIWKKKVTKNNLKYQMIIYNHKIQIRILVICLYSNNNYHLNNLNLYMKRLMVLNL